MNIWQDMSNIEHNNLINKYNNIKTQIQKLNSKKANCEKKRKYTEQETLLYNTEIKKLQEQYSLLEVYYRCPNCNEVFRLTFVQFKTLIKDNTKLLFCSVKCSGKFYSKKQHNEETNEQKLLKNLKISNTLKQREKYLSQEEKDDRCNKLNAFWNNLNNEERRIRNSNNAMAVLENLQNNGGIWVSNAEYKLYNLLSQIDNLDVKHQQNYNGMIFDFMIKYNGEVTLVELNGVYWHNKRPFNNSPDHIKEYNELANKSIRCKRIADKWRYNDTMKLNYCRENNINFIVLYYDRQIDKEPEKVCSIIIKNLNSGVKILLSKDLDL